MRPWAPRGEAQPIPQQGGGGVRRLHRQVAVVHGRHREADAVHDVAVQRRQEPVPAGPAPGHGEHTGLVVQ